MLLLNPYKKRTLDYHSVDYFQRAEALGGSFDLANEVDAYDSDFSAGTDGWTTINGTATGNIDGIGGLDDNLRFTGNAVNNVHYTEKRSLTDGSSYDYSFDVYLPSSNSKVDGIRVTNTGPTEATNFTSIATDSWVTISGTITGAGTGGLFIIALDGTSFNFAADGEIFYIRNVQIRNTAYSTYTESYVKNAISQCVSGLKTDGIWHKITEAYLLCGVTFPGITAKLKYASVATLTNNNFVSGDLVTAGSGAGLTGGNTKSLDTSVAANALDKTNNHLSAYGTNLSDGPGTDAVLLGAGNLASNALALQTKASTSVMRYFSAATTIYTATLTDNFAIVTSRGVAEGEYYINGSSSQTDTTNRAGTLTSVTLRLLASGGGGTPTAFSGSTMTFASIGTALTDTDAANLSKRINFLMYKLGADVYVDEGIIADMQLDADVEAYANRVLDIGGNWDVI